MTAAEAIEYASIAELQRLIRAKEVSPVEIVQTLLARIEKYESSLHTFVTLTPEDLRRIEEVFPNGAAAGPRYPEQMMALLDSRARKAS